VRTAQKSGKSSRAITRRMHACSGRQRAEDDEDSDLDLLVDPTPETTLIDLAQIQLRLEALLGVRVDVLTPKSLPETFRARVVAESVPV